MSDRMNATNRLRNTLRPQLECSGGDFLWKQWLGTGWSILRTGSSKKHRLVIVALIAWLWSYWKNKVLPRGRLSGWSRPMRAIWKVTRLPGLRVSTAIRKGFLMPVRWQRDHELYRRVLETGRVILLTAWLRASQSAWWSCELSELMRTTPEAIY